MSDQGTDANTDTGGSSTPATSADGDLVHTVDMGIPTIPEGGADADPEGANKTGGDKADVDPKATQGDVKTGDQAGDKGDTDGDRFDKHPRFQQLIQKTNALETQNTQLRQELEGLKTQPSGQKPADLPFKDISQMEDEEVLEWQQKDPKGFAENQRLQLRYEMSQEVGGQFDRQNYESAIERTFESFAQKHPDFDEMWDQGLLKTFMDRNPGHNAISAYYLLTGEQKMEEAVEAAKQEATETAEKKFNEDLKARRESKVLSSGPSPTSGTVDTIPPELQDTKKHGGRTTVLARRSEARRIARQQGGK
jgi:hypothetical protein